MKMFNKVSAGFIAVLLAFPIAPSAIAFALDDATSVAEEVPVINDRPANDAQAQGDQIEEEEAEDFSGANGALEEKVMEDAESESAPGDSKSLSADEESEESGQTPEPQDVDQPIDLQSLANSWRYSSGMPSNAISAFARVSGNTWIEKNGVYYSSDGTVVEGAEAFGIDVSQWNGDIDWKKVKAAGVDYAIIRCGYGGNSSSQDDPYFVEYVKGAQSVGIDIGVYIYSYGWDAATGKSEAEHVLRMLNKAGLSPSDLAYPVYYDLEQESVSTGKPCGIDDSGKERPASNSALLSMTKAFANTIESAGYEVGVYANLNWWNNYLTSSTYDQWSKWIAQYNYQCDYQGDYAMWQCMSDGLVNGISGNVDINFYYGLGYEKLDALAKANADVLADGVYTVASAKDPSKVLDVNSASVANGGNVQLYASNGTNAQQWRVSHDAQGYVTFTNINSGKVLDVKSGGYSNGTNVQQYTSNGSRAQKWIVVPGEDGFFEVLSALKTNTSLDVKSGSTVNKANVQIYESNGTAAQAWLFTEVGDVRAELDALAAENRDILNDGETYYIASELGNGSLLRQTPVLDVKSAGTTNSTNVQIYAANATKAQQWRVSHDGQGYVTFTSVNSGKVLDVSGAKYISGTNVQQYTANDTYAQKWVVTKEDGGYMIRSALWTGICLDVATGTATNASNVHLKQVGTSVGNRQLWSFTSIDASYDQLDDLAAENASVLADGIYVIKSALADTKVVDVTSGSTANAANVQLYASNMTGAQQWSVSHDAKGYITFTNAKSGKVLDVKSAKFANGTNVQQYESNDTRSQKWIVIDDGKESFRIVSALWPDLALDVKNASTANKANVQIYMSNGTKAQSWQFLSLNLEVEECDDLGLVDMYTLQSAIDESYVVDIKNGSKSNGANVQLYKSNGTNAQKFRFEYVDGYYQIINIGSGKAIDVEDGNLVPSTNVQQWSSSKTNDNQFFSVVANEDGSYTFISKSTGLALDVKNGKAQNESNIQGYSTNGTTAQSFILES